MNRIKVSIILSLFCTLIAQAQAPRGFSPSDLARLRDVADVQISPDDSNLIFTVTELAPEISQRISRLWSVTAAGGEPRRLTDIDFNVSSPRFSPDGKQIAFYSTREGKTGLWVVNADGGEPRLLTFVYRTNFYLKSAGESFTWAPDGKRIAFLSSIEVLGDRPSIPAPTGQLAGLPPQVLRPLTREEIDKLPIEVREMIFRAQGQSLGRRPASVNENMLSALPDDPRVITRLQYKSRTAFSDSGQSHIFVIDIDGGNLRQLTTGPFYDHSINWSPGGDEIAFVSNHEPDPDKVNNTDLFAVNVESFAVRQLTKTKGCEWNPVFSPDGSRIAYLGTRREITTIDSVAEDTQAYFIPSKGGQAVEVSHPLDRRVSALKWAPDGRALHFLIADHGRMVPVAAGLNQQGLAEPPRRLLDLAVQVSGFAAGANSMIAFIFSDPTRPAEVYTGKLSATGIAPDSISQITDFNRQLIDRMKTSGPREIGLVNDGMEVQGWVYLPLDIAENKKYPVILSIHGGPHGMHGYGFNPTVQALVSQGYGVVLINPRGSSGYGQKFADGCVNDWGGGDYRDLMTGVDEALARFPALDGDRLGVTGGSYGGYMTNWVITQTGRFKAAVSIASLSNLISFYSTSLYQDLIHVEFHGYPWDNFDILWDRSPLKHIKNAGTPLLLAHGEEDNDVHITQAEEMFTAMKMRGIETNLVRYPREGHGFSETRHKQDLLARTILWFDRFLKK